MYFKNKIQTPLDKKTSPDLALGYDLTSYSPLGSTCTELLQFTDPKLDNTSENFPVLFSQKGILSPQTSKG